ncbi:MAG: DUF3179 domain-containing protein [Candidatus Scalindua sp.]|nr:DUF3179 domain-containing protein [Candidatus Scalindua sp.]
MSEYKSSALFVRGYLHQDLVSSKTENQIGFSITDEFDGMNLLVYRNNDTGIIKVYDRQVDRTVIKFEKNRNDTTDSTTNTTWDLENGIGIKWSMMGKTLRHVNFLNVYWFIWSDCNPETEVFDIE